MSSQMFKNVILIGRISGSHICEYEEFFLRAVWSCRGLPTFRRSVTGAQKTVVFPIPISYCRSRCLNFVTFFSLSLRAFWRETTKCYKFISTFAAHCVTFVEVRPLSDLRSPPGTCDAPTVQSRWFRLGHAFSTKIPGDIGPGSKLWRRMIHRRPTTYRTRVL